MKNDDQSDGMETNKDINRKQIIEEKKDEAMLLMCNMEIANVKMFEGKLKEAKALMYGSYNKAKELGLVEHVKNSSEGLQKLYEKLGNSDSAYRLAIYVLILKFERTCF